MDKVRKVGFWLWRNVEKFLLVILVVCLCFQVKRMLYPDLGPAWRPPALPKPTGSDETQAQEAMKEIRETMEIGDPPDAPLPQAAGDLLKITQANPFSVYGARVEIKQTGRQEPAKPNIQVRAIRKWRDGKYVAEIGVDGGRPRRIEEGKKFGKDNEYVLQRIDSEGQSVEVFSELQNKAFEYKVEQAG